MKASGFMTVSRRTAMVRAAARGDEPSGEEKDTADQKQTDVAHAFPSTTTAMPLVGHHRTSHGGIISLLQN